jgi:hypothetical protein
MNVVRNLPRTTQPSRIRRRERRAGPRIGCVVFGATLAAAIFLSATVASPAAEAQGSTTSTTVASTSTVPATTSSTPTTTTSPSSTTSSTTTSSTTPATTSVTTSATTLPVPGEVRDLLAATTAANQVTLRWSAPVVTNGLTGYRITVEPSGAITNVPANQTSVVLTLAPGKYSFAIVAVGPNGAVGSPPARVSVFLQGDTTTVAATTTTTTVPVLSAPLRVTATPSGVGQVNVFWEPPVWSQAAQGTAGVKRVKEYRITSVPGSSTVVVPATSLSATFAGLAGGVTYYFSVRAVSDDGVSSEAGLSGGVVLAVSTTVSVVPATTPSVSIVVPPQPTQPPSVPTPPGVPKPCVTAAWSRQYRGTPITFRKGAPAGAYVWFDGRSWQLRLFHPGPEAVIFTGSVQANAAISSAGVQLDPRTDIVRRGRTSVSFSFRALNDVDGLRISAPCATLLSLRFEVNGQPMPVQQIAVGASAANPSSQPVQVVR